jgi:hypothetical protein
MTSPPMAIRGHRAVRASRAGARTFSWRGMTLHSPHRCARPKCPYADIFLNRSLVWVPFCLNGPLNVPVVVLQTLGQLRLPSGVHAPPRTRPVGGQPAAS